MDFLQGIARVRKDATARKIMGLNRPNQWSLISLLVDVKFPPEEEKALMDKLSYFESHGIKHLQTKQSKELSKEGVQCMQTQCSFLRFENRTRRSYRDFYGQQQEYIGNVMIVRLTRLH